jgi:aryl-alcohol dehydrogenase-like predicted oxidoreductase
MPIRGLLDVQEAAFDPEDITAMVAAHEMALKRLGVTDRKSAMAFLVAKTVVQIATGGERDPKRLSERVIRALQPRASE